MDNFVKAVQNNNALYCSLFFKKEPDANAKKKMANAQKDGFYVAHWACFHDNVQLLLLLMHYGANMGCKTLKNAVRADVGIGFSKGTTLLHACAVSDSPACITALLEENKVDANAKDALGRTALHLASSLGHAGVVKAMLMSSFNHDLKIDSKCPVDSHTSTQGVWVRGSTALMRSARASADIMRMLLATGRADPTARDDNGWTVAHYAAEGAIPEIIDLLVENKVPMNARSSRGSKRLVEGTTEYRNYTQSGFTPLHVCVRFEHKDEESALKCIDALVSVVDVNATDVRGWTALHWACYRSMFEVVRRLLDSSVDRRRPFDLGVRSTGLVVSKIPTRSDHDPRSSSLARRPTSMYSQRLSGMGQGEGDFQVLEFTPGSTASDLCCIKDAFDCVELLIRFRGRWSDLLEKHAVDEEEEEWVAHARGVLAAYHPSELELFLEAKLDRLQQVQARHDRLAQEVKQQHQQQQQQQQHQQQQQQLDEKQPQQLEKQHGAVERVPHSHEEKGEKGEEEEEDSHAFMYTHKRMAEDTSTATAEWEGKVAKRDVEIADLRDSVQGLREALDAARKVPRVDAEASRLREELLETKRQAAVAEKQLKSAVIDMDIEKERLQEQVRTLQLREQTRDAPVRLSFNQQGQRASFNRASLLQESAPYPHSPQITTMSPTPQSALLGGRGASDQYRSVNSGHAREEEHETGWCCCPG